MARLAEGLHHAHQRGILHRDIKPSNILIAADGQPLLLDFNLARSGEDDPAHATIGGTIAYMAPEHLRALVGRTPALIRQVDQRSDIYSLGMVLAEMLTGHRPFAQSGSYSAIPLQIEAMALERSKAVASVRRDRPDLSWGLESIARKCLAADPEARYQRADHLADDLRRLLEDRPLGHAPELSRAERARKFARRHPRLASAGSVAGAAVLVLLVVGSALAAARSQLADSRARDLVRAHDAGVMKALCLVNTRLELRDHLREGIDACERTLGLLGDPGSGDGMSHPAWEHMAPDDRRRVAEDRRELLLLLADASVRLAGETRDSAERALRLLDAAESIPGLPDSRALWLDRARYWSLRGDDARSAEANRRAENTPATTARDHYLIAASLARQGGPESLRAAIGELDEALRLNPRHFWSLVQRGICRLERGELVEAAGDFGQSTGLWPEFAWGYFNRGCVLDRAGDKAAAILDYSAALERDPGLVPAHVNRGLARLECRQDAPALADFDRAMALGARARPSPPVAAWRWSGWAGTRRPMPPSPTDGIRPATCTPSARRGWPGPSGSPWPPATPGGPGRPSTRRCGTTRAMRGALRPRHAGHDAGRGRAGAAALRPGPRGRPRPGRGPPLPGHPAGSSGRLERGDPRDQRLPRARAAVAGDAVRGRVRPVAGPRGPRLGRDRRAGAGPPRAGRGRGSRPLARRR